MFNRNSNIQPKLSGKYRNALRLSSTQLVEELRESKRDGNGTFRSSSLRSERKDKVVSPREMDFGHMKVSLKNSDPIVFGRCMNINQDHLLLKANEIGKLKESNKLF